MKSQPISSRPRRSYVTAIATGAAALALALAGPANARPETAPVIGEHANDQGAQQLPQVVDPPSDRATTAAALSSTQSASTSSSGSGSDDGALIVGLSLATVALLGSGTFVARRRRHVQPG